MDFAFSTEQEELRRTVRGFLADRSPESEVRRLMDTDDGFDRAVWTQLAAQLGLVGLAIPEEHGGAGYGFLELCVVLEEMGRALICAPYLSTAVLAPAAILSSGDDVAAKELLPRIAAGDLLATVAFAEGEGPIDTTRVSTQATRSANGWSVTGTKDFVIDGHTADVVIVPAQTDAGTSLFLVAADASGVRRTLLSTLDQTRKLARIELDEAPAQLLGQQGDGARVLEHVVDIACVALAAEQVGGAQRCLDMAVAYAKERVQFGRPIGSFQAVKHKCADLLVEVESAKSAAYYAAWCAATGSDELPVMASLAASFCSEAYTQAAADNIQLHGGIGFTWEHPAHLYLKRAKSSELLFGSASGHRARLADRLGV